ncbi:MAG: carbamate kinase [Syntrophobacteraceae bacterium]|jgi:carbamate kinase|nr:carbamate kinase [Syntrophobacteraceae bacterium]
MHTSPAVQKPTILIALGGNALIRKGEEGSIADQLENLRTPMRQIARLSRRYRIVVTHGNGPQVGNLLLQQECCGTLPRLPLEILVAQTQGQIGYMIESTLDNELMELGLDGEQLFVSILSYVVVDEKDPAFSNPTKPIGPGFSESEALALPYPTTWTPKGYRRVVASPRPLTIVEKREIRRLIQMGFLVIACGGGGIPVVRERRAFHGVDAVIDKDLASAVLAREVEAEMLVIATDVPGVALSYGLPGQRFLDRLSPAEAAFHLGQGELPEGSMKPKVEAACDFVERTGKVAVICHIGDIEKAVSHKAGTLFPPEQPRTARLDGKKEPMG